MKILRRRLLLLSSIAVLQLLAVSVAFAQTATPAPTATPDPGIFTPTSLIAGGSSLMNTFGLFALVTVAAFIGVAVLIVRRMKRAAR